MTTLSIIGIITGLWLLLRLAGGTAQWFDYIAILAFAAFFFILSGPGATGSWQLATFHDYWFTTMLSLTCAFIIGFPCMLVHAALFGAIKGIRRHFIHH